VGRGWRERERKREREGRRRSRERETIPVYSSCSTFVLNENLKA
jgi:hypothetical protein